MIGTANGYRVSITGIGANAPERVMTNEELSKLVDTSDEWIVVRTGIRERRIAREDEALSDVALPAVREALEMAGVGGPDLDLIVCATVTPDMAFPARFKSSAAYTRTKLSSSAVKFIRVEHQNRTS